MAPLYPIPTSHLCALILVEAVDLDYVYQYMTDHSKLQSHHLKDPSATAIVKVTAIHVSS